MNSNNAMKAITFTVCILIFSSVMANITGCATQSQPVMQEPQAIKIPQLREKTWQDYRVEILKYLDRQKK
jgi:hypothetical protein